MVRAWLVRADESTGLAKFEREGFVGIRGGPAEPQVVDADLTGVGDEEIAALVARQGLPGNYTAMLRHIVRSMSVGDLVVSPGARDEPDQEVAVGTVASDYYFHAAEPLRHRRDVHWEGRVPRSAVPTGFWAGKVSALAEVDPADVPRLG